MIGSFRHRVTLAAPAQGPAPTDPPDWYCAIASVSTAMVDGQQAYFLRGRYHPGITTETVIDFEGRTLQVQAITDVDERHVSMQVLAVEVAARGR